MIMDFSVALVSEANHDDYSGISHFSLSEAMSVVGVALVSEANHDDYSGISHFPFQKL